jgi:hypothetical protein
MAAVFPLAGGWTDWWAIAGKSGRVRRQSVRQNDSNRSQVKKWLQRSDPGGRPVDYGACGGTPPGGNHHLRMSVGADRRDNHLVSGQCGDTAGVVARPAQAAETRRRESAVLGIGILQHLLAFLRISPMAPST